MFWWFEKFDEYFPPHPHPKTHICPELIFYMFFPMKLAEQEKLVSVSCIINFDGHGIQVWLRVQALRLKLNSLNPICITSKLIMQLQVLRRFFRFCHLHWENNSWNLNQNCCIYAQAPAQLQKGCSSWADMLSYAAHLSLHPSDLPCTQYSAPDSPESESAGPRGVSDHRVCALRPATTALSLPLYTSDRPCQWLWWKMNS